jgi:protein-disulfide isomerase
MEHDHTNHEHHTHPHHPKGQNLAVPIAIVIAGALIAFAIYASKSGSTGGAVAQASTIEAAAKTAGIKAKDLTKCTESDKYLTKITDFVAEAQSTGGNGTPWSIVIGPTGKKYPLSGAQPIEKVKAIIDLALADSPVTGADPKLENVKPVTAADHYRGDINAPVKIVQFTDIDCPFCKKFHSTMQEVMKTYGKDKKVTWVMRHLPLTQLHPDAANKAEASECVAELGGNDKFWSFVDALSK